MKRLASLDILRGFDLFLLLFIGPLVSSLASVSDAEWTTALAYHFDHATWEGLRMWDLVMPLFMFMAGVSMPFALRKDVKGTGIWRRILKRVILLFLLGMVVQGGLLTFNWNHFTFYTNTLQAIGFGYGIAAICLLTLSVRMQVLATIALLVIYAIPMMLTGNYSQEGNFANLVDVAILGSFRGDPSYTWVWSTLTFGATTMLGALSGQVIRYKELTKQQIALILVGLGFLLLALGYLWGNFLPVNKRLWTSSMTLVTGGYCYLLLALFYYVIDVLEWSRGLEWLKWYGMNAIAAYMIGECINFRSVVHSVSYGLQPFLGDYYPLFLTFGNSLVLLFILRWMYRNKIFWKV